MRVCIVVEKRLTREERGLLLDKFKEIMGFIGRDYVRWEEKGGDKNGTI